MRCGVKGSSKDQRRLMIIDNPYPLQVRVNALVCLTKTRICYGRQVLVDAILPTLRVRTITWGCGGGGDACSCFHSICLPAHQVCLERDKDPAVVMASVAAYDCVLSDVDPSYICTHALPVLAPLLYLRTLSRCGGGLE